MRTLIVPLALFAYVAMDISVNHGASLRGWIALLHAVARTAGLA